jgi:hypothetical protein
MPEIESTALTAESNSHFFGVKDPQAMKLLAIIGRLDLPAPGLPKP